MRTHAPLLVVLMSVIGTSFLIGCFQEHSDTNSHSVLFSKDKNAQGVKTLNGKASWSEKRGFDDYNCDGIVDMIEIEDDAWVGQDYRARIFFGKMGKNNIVSFQDPQEIKLDIKLKWFSSRTKLDSGDIDGDGCADIIFSQYKEGITKDRYDISIGVNQGSGLEYRFTSDVVVQELDKLTSLGNAVILLAESFDDEHGSYDEDINDYFMIDWEDLDGDGKDDMVVFWRPNLTSLYVDAFFSNMKQGSSQVTFKPNAASVALRKVIPARHRISDVDIEDFNGDGFADLAFIQNKIGNTVSIKFGLNTASRQRQLGFKFEPSFTFEEIDQFATVGFEKVDTADVNGDGCADYIHVGKVRGEPQLYYKLIQCKK